MNNDSPIYWHYHCEGTRCFIVTAEGYTVCEIIAPGNNDPVHIARQIVREHNDAM